MPQETAQPLRPDQPHDPRDEKLVGQVLGAEAEAEMVEMVGRKTDQIDHTTSEGLELTADEAVTTKAVEQETTPEQRRLQYYEWAEEIHKDEAWVDGTFTFETDGSVVVNGDLYLHSAGLSRLPPGLKEVKGNCYLADNELISLKNMPKKVGGLLDLGLNQLISLEGMPEEVGGLLDVSLNEGLTSLVGLPKSIGGRLCLEEIPATEIPAGININDTVSLDRYQTELIASCEANGYKYNL